MPAVAEGTPICYLARYRECSFQGPEFTSTFFRRLNSTAQPRVIICDVGGPDVPAGPLNPAVIPSEDVTLTANQRRILAENHSKEGEWLDKMPTLSDVLDAGMYTTDYAFAHGALAYDQNHMADV
ncbi:hypothetical protein CKM354_000350600 [Cercospora kikuchii]|uniref:Uncharacterized protein n=1 Tax=Cercospora kikuchii TaxID=84275 RepID=A0A9P3FEV2_9PEZI|nr:uncharacterized protein CKM354_000350600 [Cercospora kikuchii]GIZ40154.1 hypothetical protein CKM354_000350600 [Cercospora kikuchii]